MHCDPGFRVVVNNRLKKNRDHQRLVTRDLIAVLQITHTHTHCLIKPFLQQLKTKLFHLLHNSTDEPAKKMVKEKKKTKKKTKGKGNNGIPSTTVPPTPPSDSDGVAPIPPPVTEGEIKDEL